MANKKKSGNKKQAPRPSSNTDLARAAANATTRKQNQSKQNKGNIFKRFVAYVKGVRQEFSKVVWPTREELTTDTIVVFATVLFFALAFWLIDTGFLAALRGILGITLS